eukprot:TRINITY_DN64065_c0_g1_i1.p1 TRINITY_DN64065_c0_g1~~TRINITY_DN64065_c0_g1_i1.p1  ORF type:complete len:153 (+),score=19.14 TRINITY_DN64065_c0_g1_i1:132-590(+)
MLDLARMVQAFLLSASFARIWTFVTAVFEIPILYQVATSGASATSKIVRDAHKSVADASGNEKGECSAAFSRLYFCSISVLLLTRVAFFIHVESPGAALVAAAVHVVEAGFFLGEATASAGGLRCNAGGLLPVIVGQGLWYVAYATKLGWSA